MAVGFGLAEEAWKMRMNSPSVFWQTGGNRFVAHRFGADFGEQRTHAAGVVILEVGHHRIDKPVNQRRAFAHARHVAQIIDAVRSAIASINASFDGK